MGDDRSCYSRCRSEHGKVATQLVIRGQINAARKAAPTSSGAKAKVMIQKATQSKVWGTQGDTESIGKDSNNEILFHPSA